LMIYINQTLLTEITDSKDLKAINDLRKERLEIIMMINDSKIEQRLSNIRLYVKELEFDSIFDIAVAEAKSINVKVKRCTKRWLRNGEDILLLSILISNNDSIQSENV